MITGDKRQVECAVLIEYAKIGQGNFLFYAVPVFGGKFGVEGVFFSRIRVDKRAERTAGQTAVFMGIIR